MVGTSRQQEAEEDGRINMQSGESNAFISCLLVLSSFLFSYVPRIPCLGNVPPTVGVSFCLN